MDINKKKELLKLIKQYKTLKQSNFDSDIKKDFGVTGKLALKAKVVYKQGKNYYDTHRNDPHATLYDAVKTMYNMYKGFKKGKPFDFKQTLEDIIVNLNRHG